MGHFPIYAFLCVFAGATASTGYQFSSFPYTPGYPLAWPYTINPFVNHQRLVYLQSITPGYGSPHQVAYPGSNAVATHGSFSPIVYPTVQGSNALATHGSLNPYVYPEVTTTPGYGSPYQVAYPGSNAVATRGSLSPAVYPTGQGSNSVARKKRSVVYVPIENDVENPFGDDWSEEISLNPYYGYSKLGYQNLQYDQVRYQPYKKAPRKPIYGKGEIHERVAKNSICIAYPNRFDDSDFNDIPVPVLPAIPDEYYKLGGQCMEESIDTKLFDYLFDVASTAEIDSTVEIIYSPVIQFTPDLERLFQRYVPTYERHFNYVLLFIFYEYEGKLQPIVLFKVSSKKLVVSVVPDTDSEFTRSYYEYYDLEDRLTLFFELDKLNNFDGSFSSFRDNVRFEVDRD